jgi:hypothetical protein
VDRGVHESCALQTAGGVADQLELDVIERIAVGSAQRQRERPPGVGPLAADSAELRRLIGWGEQIAADDLVGVGGQFAVGEPARLPVGERLAIDGAGHRKGLDHERQLHQLRILDRLHAERVDAVHHVALVEGMQQPNELLDVAVAVEHEGSGGVHVATRGGGNRL